MSGDNQPLCQCRQCLRDRNDQEVPGCPTELTRMVLCPTCGNKRCPHATDHRHACTGSNEPGQIEGRAVTKYGTRHGTILATEAEGELVGVIWHASWEAAHAFIIVQAESDCLSARLRLEKEEARLAEIRGMKRP